MDDFGSKTDSITNGAGPGHARVLAEASRRSAQAPVEEMQNDDNLESIQQMFGDNFIELATLFRNDGPKRLSALHNAASRRDAAEGRQNRPYARGQHQVQSAPRQAFPPTLCKKLEKCNPMTGSLDDTEGQAGSDRHRNTQR